jgi:hypothetical protein
MATSGPTTAGQPYRFKSSAPHPAEPEPPSARAELRALRSAERRPWSRSFAPLSPVPPEVEPYLPFFCSKSSSYFRVRSRDSRFNFFLTPMATSGRTAAGQPYRLEIGGPRRVRRKNGVSSIRSKLGEKANS